MNTRIIEQADNIAIVENPEDGYIEIFPRPTEFLKLGPIDCG
jgi:hypothetical protein